MDGVTEHGAQGTRAAAWRARIGRWGQLAMAAGTLWGEQRAGRTAAALAFYTLFSLAPILVIATAVAGAVWGVEAVQGRLVGQLAAVVGAEGGRLIEQMIANAHTSAQTGVAAIVGVVAVLLGASAVFAELRNAFEDLWAPRGVAGNAGFAQVVMVLIKTRLRGMAVVVGIGFVLMCSLALSSALVALAQAFRPAIEELSAFAWLLALVPLAVSIAVTSAMLAALLRALLPVRVPHPRLVGTAVFGAVVFEFAKFAVSLYLGRSAVTSTFGAAGSLAVLLIWLYAAASVVLLCAVVLRALTPDTITNRLPPQQ